MNINIDNMNEPYDNQLKVLNIAPVLLARIATGTYKVIKNSVPEDAEIVGSHYDYQRGCFSIVLKHISYDPIPLGQVLPIIDPPVIQRISIDEEDEEGCE